MGSVYFKPWVGRNYNKQVNPRLLVLGESHYDPVGLPQDFTITFVREYTQDERNHPFLTNIMQVVEGKKHCEIDRDAFWSGIAFYNYIQEPAAKTPRRAPTEEMWQRAEQPFFEVLDSLKPTHVLVLSRRLWDNMSDRGSEGKQIQWKGEPRDTWMIPFQDGVTKATWLRHPSSGFSAPAWNPLVAKFLGSRV